MWMSGLNILLCLEFVRFAAGFLAQQHYRYSFYWEYEENGLKNLKQNNLRFDPARSRLGVLMRGYYEDARIRSKELNNIRFVIEETYQYEVGYLMHEMYEKYKKLVEQFNKGERNRSLDYLRLYKNKKPKIKPDSLIFGNDKIERTEVAQKLYFEIFHFSNMIHEITRKWGVYSKDSGPTVAGRPGYIYDAETYNAYQADLQRKKEKHLKKIRKERSKLMKKLDEDREKIQKKKSSKGNDKFGMSKGGDENVNDFIKDRMTAQGWQKWIENRNNTKYKPDFFLRDYGWDVTYSPGQD